MIRLAGLVLNRPWLMQKRGIERSDVQASILAQGRFDFLVPADDGRFVTAIPINGSGAGFLDQLRQGFPAGALAHDKPGPLRAQLFLQG